MDLTKDNIIVVFFYYKDKDLAFYTTDVNFNVIINSIKPSQFTINF